MLRCQCFARCQPGNRYGCQENACIGQVAPRAPTTSLPRAARRLGEAVPRRAHVLGGQENVRVLCQRRQPSWGGTLRGMVQGHARHPGHVDRAFARRCTSVHRMPAPADGSASTLTPRRTGRKSPSGYDMRTNWPHLLACAAQRVAPQPRHVEGREMASERQKMLAGELYDPLDHGARGGPRARPRSVPVAQRHPRSRARGAAANPARALCRRR